MIIINGINALKNFALENYDNDWVYVDKKIWDSNPKDCIFYFITENEVEDLPDNQVYESDAGPFLPKNVEHLNLYPWMEKKNLMGVIEMLKKGYNTIADELFILAINYYREFDDFMD